nr:SPX5 [Phoebe bournei]
MKFGKSLNNQVEQALPEWRDKFLSYKELKKRLKEVIQINGGESNKRPRLDREYGGEMGEREGDVRTTWEEMDFVRLLEEEIKKLNDFFVEKEEEYIIRLKTSGWLAGSGFDWCGFALTGAGGARAGRRGQRIQGGLIRVRKEIVDFHGEMVLLENYSAINYTGLVKILKKYDKKTGALIRLPFIQRVLKQPFFNTDLLYKLVKECELMLDFLFPATNPSVPRVEDEGQEPNPPSGGVGLMKGWKELAETDSLYMKGAVSALRALMDIRSGSSTVSMFSLPPLQINVLEDCCNRIHLLEQVAK